MRFALWFSTAILKVNYAPKDLGLPPERPGRLCGNRKGVRVVPVAPIVPKISEKIGATGTTRTIIWKPGFRNHAGNKFQSPNSYGEHSQRLVLEIRLGILLEKYLELERFLGFRRNMKKYYYK